MLKLSANLKWLFTEVPLLERFNAAARAGFAAVEYPTPYEQPIATLAAHLRDCGLQMVLINTPAGDKARGEQSGLACIPDRRDAFRDDLRKGLDYAAGLGCKLLHLQAGILPLGISRDRGWATYLANVVWAADLASAAGIRLVLEPINQIDIPGFLLRTQEEGAAVVEAIGRDKIGLQFDVYHCQVEQGSVGLRLQALMPIIGHIQVADSPGRHEPGTGEIAWDYIFRRLGQLGYDGWIGCEYTPLHGTAEGLDWRGQFGFPDKVDSTLSSPH
ncbi:MAG: hydroxypyruvate isomerase family protein [Janthinobacterium lividum]